MPVTQAQKVLVDLEDLLHKNPELERRLPVRPEEPLPRDCCGQSCQPCVFDIYQDELNDWARRCWRKIENPQATDEELEEHDSTKMKSDELFSFQPNVYQHLKLISITPITDDTNIYRFALPAPKQRLFLPTGTHVIMKGCVPVLSGGTITEDDGKKVLRQNLVEGTVVRQYTPVTGSDVYGYMDLMIKLYEHGKMSGFLRCLQSQLENGAEIYADFRGPYGLFTYGPNQYSDLLMLAAGTGIAPMAQIIQCVLDNENEDMTRIRLLFCCRRYEEILLKDRLDDWRRKWNFSSCYVLSQWREETDRPLVKYGEELITGVRLNQDHIQNEVRRLQNLEQQQKERQTPESKSLPHGYQVLICGTKSFEKDMMNYLLKAGILAKRIFRF